MALTWQDVWIAVIAITLILIFLFGVNITET